MTALLTSYTAAPSASGIVADNSTTLPIEVEKIASRLGLRVEISLDLPANVSGKIYKCTKAPNGYCVELNGNQSKARQRFTLAHEIAHYVLHRDLIGDGISDDAMYRSSLSNEYEVQANRYAADILIPNFLLKREYRDCKSLAPLAQRFQVSEDALRIKLKQLGLGI